MFIMKRPSYVGSKVGSAGRGANPFLDFVGSDGAERCTTAPNICMEDIRPQGRMCVEYSRVV